MNKNGKMIMGIVIAVIIIIAVCFGVKAYLGTTDVSTNNTNVNNSNENMALIENDTIENENNVIENNTMQENNTVSNNVVENEITNEVQNNTAKNTVSSNNDSEIESENDEEKALAIVKEDWGSTDGVYFKVQAIDENGNYVISVNNEETTAVLEWYTVNPKTGEFEN